MLKYNAFKKILNVSIKRMYRSQKQAQNNLFYTQDFQLLYKL